jgi:hypothetical protein
MTETACPQKEGLFSNVSLRSLYRAWRTPENELEPHEAASTLFRFFRSVHVRDLKLITALTLALLAIFLGLVILFGIIDAKTATLDGKAHIDPWVDFFKFVATFAGSAIGVSGLVVGWTYQTAAARLGVVDLFACEISTLCRVGTVVDVGTMYVAQYDGTTNVQDVPKSEPQQEPVRAQPPAADNFVSKEDYFPILQTNAEDLQRLEALVVNDITEFYTYMKACRDYLRLLDTKQGEARRETLVGAIYMLFLGYESGRHAVKGLIEYQPTRAEDMIGILLTELKCYALLMQHFWKEKDFRYARLELRLDEYRDEVPDLYEEVGSHSDGDRDWIKAKRLLPELAKRYNDAVGESVSDTLLKRTLAGRESFDRRAARPRQQATRLVGPISGPTTSPRSPSGSTDEPQDEYRSSRNP